MGRPVVASRIPAFEDLFGGDGAAELVPVADVAAWASALISILKDTNRAGSMGRAARLRMLDEFAPHRIAGQMLDVYEERAGEPRRAAPGRR